MVSDTKIPSYTAERNDPHATLWSANLLDEVLLCTAQTDLELITTQASFKLSCLLSQPLQVYIAPLKLSVSSPHPEREAFLLSSALSMTSATVIRFLTT